MEVRFNIGFGQIVSLANQLPAVEKQKLISALQKTLSLSGKKTTGRTLGKFEGQIKMSDDFNEPLDDFKNLG